MRQGPERRYYMRIATLMLFFTFASMSSAFFVHAKDDDVGGTYGDWNDPCHKYNKCKYGSSIMGALVRQDHQCIYLYWEMQTAYRYAQYFSAGSQQGDKLYVSGDVAGEMCKAVFQVKNNSLSYVEADSDECMSSLDMGDYLSQFTNVRVSHDEVPPPGADKRYRSAKWRAAWKEASKQCPVAH